VGGGEEGRRRSNGAEEHHGGERGGGHGRCCCRHISSSYCSFAPCMRCRFFYNATWAARATYRINNVYPNEGFQININ
jgi:hypothetical protein